MGAIIAKEQIRVVLKHHILMWKWIHEVFVVIGQDEVINHGTLELKIVQDNVAIDLPTYYNQEVLISQVAL